MSCLIQERIISFLDWLETERRCAVTTRNLRLAAIHSFFRYAQEQAPESLFHFQKVIAIPEKYGRKKTIEHLTPEGIRLLLSLPDRSCPKGRRDLVMLSTLYDSGARVQELIDLSVGDAHPRCQCGSCPDRKRQQDTPCPADEEYRQPACRLPFGKPSGWSTQEDIPALYKQPAQPTDKGGGCLRAWQICSTGP